MARHADVHDHDTHFEGGRPDSAFGGRFEGAADVIGVVVGLLLAVLLLASLIAAAR
jgi:hypothetical protein